MAEKPHDIRIEIENLMFSREWSWSVKVDGDEIHGYGPDLVNTANMVEQALKEMGVEYDQD